MKVPVELIFNLEHNRAIHIKLTHTKYVSHLGLFKCSFEMSEAFVNAALDESVKVVTKERKVRQTRPHLDTDVERGPFNTNPWEPQNPVR